jgi:glycogen(starch) synthase
VGTVFTTHATILGRTLASSNVSLDSFLGKINPDEEAYKYGIQAKHQLEKACASNVDVFTTVSQITGLESETILNRFPDVLLPNGLDMSRFPSIEQISIKHKLQRDKIREFLFWYFYPYYEIDLNNTFFYYTIGRYELRNKGIDTLIKTLGALNKKLKEEKSKRFIVTFFWIPTQVQSIKRELLESREIYTDIKDQLESIEEDIEGNLMKALISKSKIEKSDIFENEEYTLSEIKNKILKFKKQGNPPVCSHNLTDQNDTILQMFQEEGLSNAKEDKVKVIFYPIYLNGADGILNLTADEAIQGSHLGVFPSMYEPWGYTPLESAALGVGSVTTDMAGFGRFCSEYIKGKKLPGIFLLERMNKTEKEIVGDLVKTLSDFLKLTTNQRVENKIQARSLANMADWEILIKNYITAHNKAVATLK